MLVPVIGHIAALPVGGCGMASGATRNPPADKDDDTAKQAQHEGDRPDFEQRSTVMMIAFHAVFPF
jgi:hypothetical protein